jgi:hypothetical protein
MINSIKHFYFESIQLKKQFTIFFYVIIDYFEKRKANAFISCEKKKFDDEYVRWIHINICDARKFINYYSFANVRDFVFAKWLSNYNLTKNVIDVFLRHENLKFMRQKFNFENANQYKKKLHVIFHDITNDNWKKHFFIVEININDIEFIKYTIHYKNVHKIMKFLLQYESFKKHLTFASSKMQNANNEKIYCEMHFENWW